MNFVHHDLGHRSRGEIVEINLSGSAANVRLLDSSNFRSYRAGRKHRYTGGLAKRSPVRLQIPHSGHWHVAVDLGRSQGQRPIVGAHSAFSIASLEGGAPVVRALIGAWTQRGALDPP